MINRITQSAKTQKFGQKDASLMHSHTVISMCPRKVILQKYVNELILLPSLKKSNNQINVKTKKRKLKVYNKRSDNLQ